LIAVRAPSPLFIIDEKHVEVEDVGPLPRFNLLLLPFSEEASWGSLQPPYNCISIACANIITSVPLPTGFEKLNFILHELNPRGAKLLGLPIYWLGLPRGILPRVRHGQFSLGDAYASPHGLDVARSLTEAYTHNPAEPADQGPGQGGQRTSGGRDSGKG
jgi:hypothetical protein